MDDLEVIALIDASFENNKKHGYHVRRVLLQLREDIESLERAQPATPVCDHFWSEGNKAFGCVLPKGHGGDHSAFAQPSVAAQGTDGESEAALVAAAFKYGPGEAKAALAALIARTREPLESLLREVLELYPQKFSCSYGSREYAHIEPQDWIDIRTKIEAALVHTEKASQPQTEGKQP